jgi:uncharacterized surface protein with fasciclin (FAS1) repeats
MRFTNLPKEQLDALLADPEALDALLRGHIVEGLNRRVTNLRGEQLAFSDTGGGPHINNQPTGPTEAVFVANGTRVIWINQLLLPAAN